MMELRVQLLGALKSQTPPDQRLQLPDGATIDEALTALGINAPQIQIVMLNGRPQPDRTRVLNSGDEMTVLPPVGGG
jgi:sulfur carrier protein ThiS